MKQIIERTPTVLGATVSQVEQDNFDGKSYRVKIVKNVTDLQRFQDIQVATRYLYTHQNDNRQVFKIDKVADEASNGLLAQVESPSGSH